MATTTQTHPLVGVFIDPEQARAALEELRRAGFRERQLGLATRDESPEEGLFTPNRKEQARDTTTTKGAAVGGLIGALVGGLISLVLVSGIGPVILYGVLAGLGAGTIVGVASTGLLPALLHMGLPEEEARYFQQELDAGRTLLTVSTEDRREEAAAILRRHGARDLSLSEYAATHVHV